MMYDIKTAEMIERIYSSDEIDYCESFGDIEIAFNADEYYINPKNTTILFQKLRFWQMSVSHFGNCDKKNWFKGNGRIRNVDIAEREVNQ